MPSGRGGRREPRRRRARLDSARARLDRHHGPCSRPGLPPVDRPVAGAGRRGRGDVTALCPDRGAARAARDPGRAHGNPRRRRTARQVAGDGLAAPRALPIRARRRFDIALAHGSHELTLTARRLGIPSTTTFDYEFAALQHQLGCRAATRVVVPEAIPSERLSPYGLRPPKLLRYPGLKEEYYLSDFEPDPGVLDALGVERSRILVVVRTPADVALYHAGIANTLLPRVLDRLGTRRGCPCGRPAQDRRAARLDPAARSALPVASRSRSRRAEPDRARGSRRLRGRHDEP